MIITKKRFNLTPGYRGKWPFNVSEVAVMMIIDKENKTALFGLIHEVNRFALSGNLEEFGFDKLINSGIWRGSDTPGVKKDLTPFFKYVQDLAVLTLGVKKPDRTGVKKPDRTGIKDDKPS